MEGNFNIGDRIMQQGQAFEITSIQEISNGQSTDVILKYRPVFEIGRYKNMICSIPVTSISLADIRRPLTEETANEILKLLSSQPDIDIEVNLKTAKTFEDANINIETAKLACRLAGEKRDPEVNFSSSKSFLLEKLVSNLAQEIAIVFDLDLEESEKLIYQHLQVDHH